MFVKEFVKWKCWRAFPEDISPPVFPSSPHPRPSGTACGNYVCTCLFLRPPYCKSTLQSVVLGHCIGNTCFPSHVFRTQMKRYTNIFLKGWYYWLVGLFKSQFILENKAEMCGLERPCQWNVMMTKVSVHALWKLGSATGQPASPILNTLEPCPAVTRHVARELVIRPDKASWAFLPYRIMEI